jgi:uncharacterized protein YndB with AHSA1/START domain
MTPRKATPVVRLERVIPASANDIYRAWLDPDLLQRWLAPGGITVERAEVEARVGGRYRVWHADSGVHIGGFECEIVELVPGERIVFHWGFAGPDRTAGKVYDSLLTITLRSVSRDATVLTLVHERLDDLAAGMPHVADKVKVGWELVLEKLAVTLGSAGRQGKPSGA